MGPNPSDIHKAGNMWHPCTNAKAFPLNFQIKSVNVHDSLLLMPLNTAIPFLRSKIGSATTRVGIVQGDPWRGLFKPKIRLIGRWLERAGFKLGNRVQVICLAPGHIELRSSEQLSDEPDCPF